MNEKLKPAAGITRKDFLKATALLPFATLGAGQTLAAPLPGATPAGSEQPQPLKVENAHFQLKLAAGQGLKMELVHGPSNLSLAAGDYSYSFGLPLFSKAFHEDSMRVMLAGDMGNGLEISQSYLLPPDKPWMEEEIVIKNHSLHSIALPDGRCGWVLPVKVNSHSVESPLRDFKFTAVPYRREPNGNRTQYADYTLLQVLTEARSSRLRSETEIQRRGHVVLTGVWASGYIQSQYPQYASEGWILTNGRQGFLITKYCGEGMEWALLDRIPISDENLGLRWGGFGIYQGDPEGGAVIASQGSHRFGITRITAFEGGMNEGFYAFRAEMESRGHGCPKDFNPPVHWNELYDNKLWWTPGVKMDEPED